MGCHNSSCPFQNLKLKSRVKWKPPPPNSTHKMGKKNQEMSQVYSNSKNEFVFGEHGGKGKHLSSFLKNLSLTGSGNSSSATKPGGTPPSIASTSSKFLEVNSNIYGSLAYGTLKTHGSLMNNPLSRTSTQRSVSMGNTGHRSPSQEHKPSRRSHSKTRYADLDDDWAAEIDEVKGDVSRQQNHTLQHSVSQNHQTSQRSYSLQAGPVLDTLHPDLAASLPNVATPNDSLDYEDFQTNLEITKLNQLNTKYAKFTKILTSDSNINIQDLRKLSWNGIPSELRALTWQILLGYLPTNKSRQSSTLKRKREEYLDGLRAVSVNFDENDSEKQCVGEKTAKFENSSEKTKVSSDLNSKEKQLYHQINIDIKRTNPTIKLYSYAQTQKSLRKILFLWAVRHPASGYVQGINDLCTPFYHIFLSNYIWQLQRKISDDSLLFIPGLLDDSGTDANEQALLADPNILSYNLDNFDPTLLSDRVSAIIEADTYWCLSRLLENITDNYIHEQPGILRQVGDLRNLISKIDVELLHHFDQEGIEFIQFAFRWMNCLLMREVSMPLVIRMWDTYLSETPLGYNIFHVYVCAAFLIKFSAELKEKDFQEILLFLQNPPTRHWTEKDIELMLSEAFIWQSLYKNAGAHLR